MGVKMGMREMKKKPSTMVLLVMLLSLLMLIQPVLAAQETVGKNSSMSKDTAVQKTYKDTDQAIFANKFLEVWVRKALKKGADTKITIKDLDKITEIRFAGSEPMTKETEAQFRKLNTLVIMGQQITDLKPRQIKYLKESAITDLELEHPSSDQFTDLDLPKLQGLYIDKGDFTNLSAFKKCTGLKTLHISLMPLTDITYIANMGKLEELELPRCSLLQDVAILTKLQSVTINRSSQVSNYRRNRPCRRRPITIFHFYAPHRFVNPNIEGYYSNHPYIPADEHWPLMYFPEWIHSEAGMNELILQSDTAFAAGTKISVYVQWDSGTTLEILADRANLFTKTGLNRWERSKNNQYTAILNNSASKVVIRNAGDEGVSLYLVTIEEPGKKIVRLVPHTFANRTEYEIPPTILVHGDGTC